MIYEWDWRSDAEITEYLELEAASDVVRKAMDSAGWQTRALHERASSLKTRFKGARE